MGGREGEEHELLMSEKENFDADDGSFSSSSSSTLLSDSIPALDYFNFKEEKYQSVHKIRDILGELPGRIFRGRLSTILPWLLVLLPSFFRPSAGPRKLHPTSWLDGLRGVAAFFVFIHHFILMWFPKLSDGYGSMEDRYNFFQWPFVRIIYSGRGMVAIFFVISGYVLAYSSLRKIRAREFDKLLDTLASSTFRRGLRLFLPALAASFISLIICRYDGAVAPWGGPCKVGTFTAQFKDWWWYFVLITNPVQPMTGTTVFTHPYTFQLWTIPREFRGSILIYVTLLCFAKCTQTVRLIGVTVLAHYFLWLANWDLYLFLIGMLFAELQFIRLDWQKANATTPSPFSTLAEYIPTPFKKAKTIAAYTLLAIFVPLSIHMLCYPDKRIATSPGYITILSYTPKNYMIVPLLAQRFWLALGAALFIFCATFSPSVTPNSLPSWLGNSSTPILQRPFNTPFAQYLADISYALYVTHAHIIFTVGKRLLNYYSTEETGKWGYIGGFCVAVVVNTLGCFWAADLFWRAVDVRSVTLGKWIAGRCFVQ